MAGIGFSLRSSYVRGGMLARATTLGHAAVIAVGPWLFAIFSLGLISIVSEQLSGVIVLAEFRVAIIYAFSLSLVGAAPLIVVATRLAANALYASRFERVLPVFYGTLCVGLLPTAVLAIVVLFVVFRVPLAYGIVTSACTLVVTLIWVTLAFCGILKDYRGITRAFSVGMLLSVVGAVAMSLFGYGAVHMVGAFASGLSVTFILLAERVIAVFGEPLGRPLETFRVLGRALVQYRVLAVGGLLGALTIWIDKWVIWGSPFGSRLPVGLLHAPVYDSAMFVAYFAILPSLATFVVTLETLFFERSRSYFGAILSHATLRTIELRRAALEVETIATLNRAITLQLGISALVIFFAPALVELLNFNFAQVAILRNGVIGATFQFVFFVATTILIFLDRQWLFLSLQALALTLNGCLTWLFVAAGIDYLGLGYVVAFVVAGAIAYLSMVATLRDLNFLTFVGNNPAV